MIRVPQGMNRRLKGSHGTLTGGALLGERRAIDGGLAWGTDKTNRQEQVASKTQGKKTRDITSKS